MIISVSNAPPIAWTASHHCCYKAISALTSVHKVSTKPRQVASHATLHVNNALALMTAIVQYVKRTCTKSYTLLPQILLCTSAENNAAKVGIMSTMQCVSSAKMNAHSNATTDFTLTVMTAFLNANLQDLSLTESVSITMESFR